MAAQTILVIAGVIATFGAFGAVLAYVNVVASANAITPAEESALNAK